MPCEDEKKNLIEKEKQRAGVEWSDPRGRAQACLTKAFLINWKGWQQKAKSFQEIFTLYKQSLAWSKSISCWDVRNGTEA
jgi:hypothetical protein